MKFFILIISAFLFAGCSGVVEVEKPSTTLKIASFNMAFCRDTIDLKIWEERKSSIMPVLEKFDFDICGSQEPYAFQVKYLAQQTPKYAYVCELLGDETPDKFASRSDKYHKRHLVLPNMNNPIWYKKDKFDVLESGKFWYSKTPEIQSGAWEEDRWDGERTCVWAKFREKKTGKEFYVFNSHWIVAQSPQDLASVKSAELLLKKIKQIAQNSTYFVMGDLNATNDFTSIKILKNSGMLKSARDNARVSDKIAKTTFVGFYGTYKNQMFIDHIFTSNNVSIEDFFVGNVYKLAPDGKKIYPSDHLPIFSTVKF